MSTKLSIIYYSTYGSNVQMAKWAEEAALKLGAEVRVRQIQELAPQAVIDSQPGWKANQEATKVKTATTNPSLPLPLNHCGILPKPLPAIISQ